MPGALPWVKSPRGLVVTVRLTPKGGRDALDGVTSLADGTPVLKARVRAAPHEGMANAALTALLAKTVGVPPSRVTLQAGATARVKTVAIEGATAELAARLTQSLGKAAA
jgi:uncharacterized protein YggU (UPF0235/DUF167 family)